MPDYVIIFEDKNYRGHKYELPVEYVPDGQLNSLKSTRVHDKMSSLRWQLSGNREVTFYEDSDGTGRTYTIRGSGSDSDTHNNNFKDCASSWRLVGGNTIPIAFSKTSTQPIVLKFRHDGIEIPSGGHMQGIQQLDMRHIVVSGSSDSVAYFFIVQWVELISSSKQGKVIKIVKINNDFRGMKHNHASGIQLAGSVLAVGTEGGGDLIKSSIVFYDLSSVNSPRVIGRRYDRNWDTAGAVGIVKRGSDFLLVVGGWDSEIVDFYVSNGLHLASPGCVFNRSRTWEQKNKDTSGWIDANWGAYQGLNLLRDSNGQIYMVGFNRNAGGHDWADLFAVDMNASSSKMLKKIDKKHVYCRDGASFRYGGGLYAPNPPASVSFLATERDIHGEITINRFPG